MLFGETGVHNLMKMTHVAYAVLGDSEVTLVFGYLPAVFNVACFTIYGLRSIALELTKVQSWYQIFYVIDTTYRILRDFVHWVTFSRVFFD